MYILGARWAGYLESRQNNATKPVVSASAHLHQVVGLTKVEPVLDPQEVPIAAPHVYET